MSGQSLLDGSALAISLFNATLLVWLGMTVLLNAERRTWGVFLAVAGLLVGAVFFLSHSLILGQGAWALLQRFNFWWYAGWAPVIASPYSWYLLMLWYTGFWDDRHSPLRRRQTPWLLLSVPFTLLLVGLLLMANPLPDYTSAAPAQPGAGPESGLGPTLTGVPLLLLAYPPYILLCIGLALDALLRPAPSGRVMGDLARRRARPWLIGASLVLLLVSLLIGLIFVWFIRFGPQYSTLRELIDRLSVALSWFDLLLSALLMAASLLLGRAIVAYEIFTGKTLPRRGFLRQWQWAVLLSAAIGLVGAASLVAQVRPVYIVLALLVLFAVFYAATGRRTYQEREQDMRRLRPFVTSPRLLDQILSPATQAHPEADLSVPFRALCQDLLGATGAVLVPLGPLAALAGAPLRYPASNPADLPPLGDLLARFDSPQTPGLPLDPTRWAGASWAVPLWSERGRVGLLLLAGKVDGDFYSLEEIEIARAGGERLVDLQASAGMARHLVALQRQRLAESQVLDRQTRRVLHDDVLPSLHAALLGLGGRPRSLGPEGREVLDLLADAHRRIAGLLRDLPVAPAPELVRLGLVGALRRTACEEFAPSFDEVSWEAGPEAERRAPNLPPMVAEVVYYAAREAIRNAAQHARQASTERPLQLKVSVDWYAGLEIRIEDNGVGLLTGVPASGAGQGLALHSTLLAVIRGSLAIETSPSRFTRVVLSVPESSV